MPHKLQHSGLNNALRNLQFSLPRGAEISRLEGNKVVGQWGWPAKIYGYGKRRTVAEEFVNCATTKDAILRFTDKYGSLDGIAASGRAFDFTLEQWRELQSKLRKSWVAWIDSPALGSRHRMEIPTLEGEKFSYDGAHLTYHVANVYQLVVFQVAQCPLKYLRMCSRPGCETPYFISPDQRERYCSKRCASIVRNERKLALWNLKKERYLANRKKRRQGVSHGPRKTR